MCRGSAVGEVLLGGGLCCVGSDATKHADALEGDFPEAGRAGLHFKKVAGRGE